MRNPNHRQRQLTVTTPEGIELHYGLATVGERLMAYLLDSLLLLGFFVALGLLYSAVLVDYEDGPAIAGAVILIVIQLAWISWFATLEIRGRGRTPGKRAMGLRVLTIDGGRLRSEALLVRNLMKQVEVQIPLITLTQWNAVLRSQGEGAGYPTLLFAAALLFTNLLPFFARQNQRAGDFLAGTVVVRTPQAQFERDLTKAATATTTQAVIPFRPEQLDIYGVLELQTLEDVLRRNRKRQASKEIGDVAKAIQARIGWTPAAGQPSPDSNAFLVAFYTEQLKFMEDKKRLGRHRDRQTRKR